MSLERRIWQGCAVHGVRSVPLQRSSVGIEMPGTKRRGVYLGESPLLLKVLSLLGVSICTLRRCYWRSWCSRWKLRAKGQLLGWTWALTSRVMDMFYISSPSDGAVLEAKTRTVSLPPCLSPGPGQCVRASCSRHQWIFIYLSVHLYLQGKIICSQITANSLVALALSWEVEDVAFSFFMQKKRNLAWTSGHTTVWVWGNRGDAALGPWELQQFGPHAEV